MTKMKMLLVFTLIFLCTSKQYEILATPSESSRFLRQSYDEICLVLQWPMSYCNTGKPNIRCNDPIPNRFTVHGLWPQRNGKTVRCLPPNHPFTLDNGQITKDLLHKMELYWPNLNSHTDIDFLWMHEYGNHGYCIWDFRNQVDYFESTLTIANKIGDVTHKLLDSGRLRFKPGYKYSVSDLEKAIMGRTKLIPKLRCNTDKDGTPQLQEILFCADKRMNLKNCNFQVTGCRDGWFQFSNSGAITSHSTEEL